MTIRIAAMAFAALLLGVAAAPTASAQVVTDPVPLLNGTEKAKLLFSIPYVQSSADVATCVACTDAGKGDSDAGEYFAVELFENGFTVANDLTAGEGVALIDYGGDSDTFCTRDVASVDNEDTMGVNAEDISHGAGRVVGTTNKLICTAFLVPVVGDPPAFITILPMYKTSKQKGGM